MMVLDPLSVHVWSAVSGEHVMRLPYTSCSWSDSISEPGSAQVDVTFSTMTSRAYLRGLDLYETVRPWKVLISIQRTPADVLHAGVLTSRSWDASSRKLTLTVGGGWTLLGKRLVVNHGLASSFSDGDVLVDDDNPVGDWALTLTGSYRDIARGIVAETLEWGQLPFTLPALEGGSFTRTYLGYDLATISDRLSDLAGIEDGPEIRFTSGIDSSGRLSFALEAASELMDHEWSWDATVPGQRVMLTQWQDDGSGMTTDVWAAGGKDSDKTVMARATSTALTGRGWPVMQSSDTGHTTVSVLATLQAYARADVATGSRTAETYGLKVGEEYGVHVGDHAHVRVEDDFLHSRVLDLKVTDVSGGSDSDWLTVQASALEES